jgi:hypothetical protein
MHGTSRNPAYWKLRKANEVAKECEQLKTANALLHSQLENKDGAMRRLELVVRERNQRVDKLIATIDRLRDQNRRLDEEATRLAEMVRLS